MLITAPVGPKMIRHFIVLVLLVVLVACSEASQLLPFYFRYALQTENQSSVLVAANGYAAGNIPLDYLEAISKLAVKKCTSPALKKILSSVPTIVNEYLQLQKVYQDILLTDKEFLDLFKYKWGQLTPISPDLVVITDFMNIICMCSQLVRATSENILLHPSGLSMQLMDMYHQCVEICEKKLAAHKNACSLLFPTVEFLSHEAVQYAMKEFNSATSLLEKNLKIISSTTLSQFNSTFVRIGLRMDNANSLNSPKDANLLPDLENRSSIDIDKIQYGLPICLEIGFQVTHSMGSETLNQLNTRIVSYQRQVVELFIKNDSKIQEMQILLLENVREELSKHGQAKDTVYEAVNAWLMSWTSLATRGLFPQYIPTPNPHPLYYSPVKHLHYYCETAEQFLTSTLKPYLLSCCTKKTLIPQALIVLKESLDAHITIGRVITTIPLYMMQGPECIKGINAPLDALVKSYLNTITEMNNNITMT